MKVGKQNILALLVFAFAFTSCASMKDFATLGGIGELEGRYKNQTCGEMKTGLAGFVADDVMKYHSGNILSVFGLTDWQELYHPTAETRAAVVHVTVHSPTELKLTCRTPAALHERIVAGEMKRKYFEIYFQNKNIMIPLIYTNTDIWRFRIGKTSGGELLINTYAETSGSIFIFGAGGASEKFYKFQPADEGNDTFAP
jgi:hypothetical protein